VVVISLKPAACCVCCVRGVRNRPRDGQQFRERSNSVLTYFAPLHPFLSLVYCSTLVELILTIFAPFSLPVLSALDAPGDGRYLLCGGASYPKGDFLRDHRRYGCRL
jgi:hypothetical protein